MSVTDVHKDPEAGTMTVTAEFDAPVERVWQVWADPRKLERWWGPPTYPATVVDHDLTPGGRVTYFMTGPEGDQPRGYWNILDVAAPHHLELEDGFADDAGEPNPDLPVTRMRLSLEEKAGGGTRMVIHSTFASAQAMEQLLAMGMEEGLQQALAQIDDLLEVGSTA